MTSDIQKEVVLHTAYSFCEDCDWTCNHKNPNENMGMARTHCNRKGHSTITRTHKRTKFYIGEKK